MTRRRIAAVLLPLALAAGCLARRPTPQIRYYTFALATDGRRLPIGVRVSGFSAVPAYRTTRLAFRRSRYRLDYYDFHRWAANPQSLLAAAIQNYFDRIGNPHDPVPVRLTGRIDRLEAVASGGRLRAVIALEFQAHGPAGLLLDRSYVEKMTVDGDDPERVVAALSNALERVLTRLTTDLAAARPAT